MVNSKGKTTEFKIKPKNLENYKKSISVGKEMMKNPDVTKVEVSKKIYEMLKDESREVIVQSFIEGVSLTPKGSMTYYYNIKRRLGKGS